MRLWKCSLTFSRLSIGEGMSTIPPSNKYSASIINSSSFWITSRRREISKEREILTGSHSPGTDQTPGVFVTKLFNIVSQLMIGSFKAAPIAG